MELFFQSFLPTAKEIFLLIKKKRKVKISLKEDVLFFVEVKSLSKEEMEESSKAFFSFIKKKSGNLHIENLQPLEKGALVETVFVFERYINFLWPKYSLVKENLEKELFSLKLGSLVPVSYIEKNTEDIKFIRDNSLEKMIFYHGICLSFDPEKGVGIPIKTLNCIKHIVFFSYLKKYTLAYQTKFYFEGEYLFSLNKEGKLVKPLKIKNGAFVCCNQFSPFITYLKGYKEPSLEVFYKNKECFIQIHDGEGRVYRFGFENKKVVSPDKYAYKETLDFNHFAFTISKEQTQALIEELLKEGMVESFLKILDGEKIPDSYFSFGEKVLSFLTMPKLLLKAFSGKIPLKSIYTPWKLKKINFKNIEGYYRRRIFYI